jgi:ATP-dependent RNA helicase RhlE
MAPTPIQRDAIPPQLAGRDILGVAQTGSGKTAAFTLPILRDIIGRGDRRQPRTARALILAPTRELAVQIDETIRVLAKGMHLSTALVLGGLSRGAQVKRLAPGVDILIATPGRLLDLVQERAVLLGETRFVVLDEADRMLDMGFIRDVKRLVVATSPARRTALFSATMPAEIEELAASLMKSPVRVEVARPGTAVATVEQRLIRVERADKKACLAALLADPGCRRTLVFTRTKRGADVVVRHLAASGFQATAIHGNKSQNARQKALDGFRAGGMPILVATDIAARGIDVVGVTHVINFELPDDAESYVHRIGRTARNGAAGVAVTLCDSSELDKLKSVERLIRGRIPPAPKPAFAAATAGPSFGDAARPGSRRAHSPGKRPANGDARHSTGRMAAGDPDRQFDRNQAGRPRRMVRRRYRPGSQRNAAA